MHPNAALITRFYEAFAQHDAEAMAACYHREVRFSDPVFQDLRGSEAGDMWRMLVSRADGLVVTFSGVEANDETGKASWEARYPFGPRKRPVHNVIEAKFVFRDGRIVEHVDTFDLYRWSKQALGAFGLLLGWLSPVHGQIRKGARKQLESYRRRNGRNSTGDAPT